MLRYKYAVDRKGEKKKVECKEPQRQDDEGQKGNDTLPDNLRKALMIINGIVKVVGTKINNRNAPENPGR